MDIIFLHNLKVDAVIGIWDWERKIRQTVEIDLDMAADIRKAAATDEVADTLNYKLVAKRVQSFVAESEFQLVETLAERIAGIVTGEFDVPWVRVRVNKPGAIRGARDVGVLIERGERQGPVSMATVYLGLGSNIDAENNLRLAVRELRRLFGELIVSPVYSSAALGFDGPDFLNLVVAWRDRGGRSTVLGQIERIHEMAGRSRGPDKYSSRPLDIDLLLYDDIVDPEPPLRLPRRDILEYGFVLRPLADIAPDLVHPVTGRTIGEHWREFDDEGHPLTPVPDIL